MAGSAIYNCQVWFGVGLTTGGFLHDVVGIGLWDFYTTTREVSGSAMEAPEKKSSVRVSCIHAVSLQSDSLPKVGRRGEDRVSLVGRDLLQPMGRNSAIGVVPDDEAAHSFRHAAPGFQRPHPRYAN